VSEIERLRRHRMSGPQIARQLGMPVSTVGGVLRRLGLNRLAALEDKRRSCATSANAPAS